LTVPNTNTKVVYQGNGAATVFPVPFAFYAAPDLVIMRVDAGGGEHILTRDCFVDMTAKTVIYPGWPPGETPPQSEQPPPLPAGEKLLIYRGTPKTQETDLPGQTVLSEIERMDDKAMMCVQELTEEVSRAVVFPVSADFDGRLPSPVVPGASVAISNDGKTMRYGANPDEALAKANNALSASAVADVKAAAAQNTANTAVTKANAAQNTADTAVSKANAAQSIADTAVTKANAAQSTADTALAAANAISVKGKDAIQTTTGNRATTVALTIQPGDTVLSQSSSGLIASVGLTYADDVITLTGRGGAVLGEADISWISGLARQAIADSSNIMALLSTDEAWTLDFTGGLTPRPDAAATDAWDLDENGGLAPKDNPAETFFWAVDDNGDLIPKTGGMN
jgi:hypothetical protein